ncbi:hypothetical protein ACNOYE_39525 [Nannocystaceae bacterium ST9]
MLTMVEQGLLGGRRGATGERADLGIGQLTGRICLIDQRQLTERPSDADMLAGGLVAGARPPGQPRHHRDAARVRPAIASVEFTDSPEPCVLDLVDAAGEFSDLPGEVFDGFQTIDHRMNDGIGACECQVESRIRDPK